MHYNGILHGIFFCTGAEWIFVTDGIGPVYSNFNCSGTESYLVNCSQPVLAPSYCSSSTDVGVSCSGIPFTIHACMWYMIEHLFIISHIVMCTEYKIILYLHDNAMICN